MKYTNSNGIFMLLVVLLHGPSSTQEFNIEIPKECQHFCDSKRPKRKNGPYLLTCYDNDCSDISCETHKCPSAICKNGRTIFCPSTKGGYHSNSRAIKGPAEAAPIESGDSTFNFVFWAFSAFIIIGICCALISWSSSRKDKRSPEGHMPAGYIHSHQDEYRRPREKGGGCFSCCVGGNEEEYHPKRNQMERPSVIFLEEDEEEETNDKPYSLDKVRSEQTMVVPDPDTKANISVSTTEIQEVRSVSSISIIKAPPVQFQASKMDIPSISVEVAESASSIEIGMEADVITYQRSSI